jgi:GTP-binding protein
VGCLPPQGGQRRWLRLELKLIADVGLLGVPNAGKSTLLDAITNAKPKIADYPFTTLVPNLGVCHVDDVDKAIVIADIPGLVEGAHDGVGLGKAFLRHVERCKVLIHVIDGSSEDPVGDYMMVNKELLLHSPVLARKPQIVVLNKIDLPPVLDSVETIRQRLLDIMPHSRLLLISGKSRDGLTELVTNTWKFFKRVCNEQGKSNLIFICVFYVSVEFRIFGCENL